MNRNSLSAVDSVCNGTCPDTGREQLVREDGLRESLRIYEGFAGKAQAALLDAFKADPAAMAARYSHLRKAHLPPLTPNPSLSAAFTSVEAALARAALPTSAADKFRAPTPMPVFSPHHPEHVPLTPDEELRPFVRDSAESGLIGLSPALADYYGVGDAARAAESRLRRLEARAPMVSRDPAIGRSGPVPWKPAINRS